MNELKTIIFIITCILGTTVLVKGAFSYISIKNNHPKRTLVLTSILVTLINIIGSLMMVYIEHI